MYDHHCIFRPSIPCDVEVVEILGHCRRRRIQAPKRDGPALVGLAEPLRRASAPAARVQAWTRAGREGTDPMATVLEAEALRWGRVGTRLKAAAAHRRARPPRRCYILNAHEF